MEVFVGRQPILDAARKLYGYELLFRDGPNAQTARGADDGDRATSSVILASVMDLGLDRVVGDARVFINCTERLLLGSEIERVLPARRTVIEVLETVEPRPDIVAAIARLADLGFMIALDDFVLADEYRPFIELADIIKVDVRAVAGAALRAQVEALRGSRATLLAEKVETADEFDACRSLGFGLFQGWFFCRPETLNGGHAESNRITTLRLMARAQEPGVDLRELAEMVSLDASLSYAFLRVINSPLYAGLHIIDSVQDAIVRMGLDSFRQWMSLLAMARLSQKPQELLVTGVLRARMCALLGADLGLDPNALFTVGLFSILDALFDRPMPELLAEIPLSDEAVAAILRLSGVKGAVLRLVLDHERGRHSSVADLGLRRRRVNECWYAALDWTHQVMGSLSDSRAPART